MYSRVSFNQYVVQLQSPMSRSSIEPLHFEFQKASMYETRSSATRKFCCGKSSNPYLHPLHTVDEWMCRCLHDARPGGRRGADLHPRIPGAHVGGQSDANARRKRAVALRGAGSDRPYTITGHASCGARTCARCLKETGKRRSRKGSDSTYSTSRAANSLGRNPCSAAFRSVPVTG
jgi:hypothetical protein